MFHYQKDIDAWRRHTLRLSPLEKGVYGELLDELYSTEASLPNDADELYRIAGASKPDERKAVDKVLARFFESTPGGYVQSRAMEEIAEYQAFQERSRSNGKKGGRPPKKQNPEITQTKTQTETPGLFLGSEKPPENTDFENPDERQSVKPLIQELPPNPQRGKSSPVGIKAFLDHCRTSGESAVPDGDPVFAYAEQVGIPHEFLRLAWREFVDRHRESDKRYRDWRKAFRNSVRGNWYRLWWATADGSYELTTVGVQAQRKHTEPAA